jgi:hypothetical protein
LSLFPINGYGFRGVYIVTKSFPFWINSFMNKALGAALNASEATLTQLVYGITHDVCRKGPLAVHIVYAFLLYTFRALEASFTPVHYAGPAYYRESVGGMLHVYEILIRHFLILSYKI